MTSQSVMLFQFEGSTIPLLMLFISYFPKIVCAGLKLNIALRGHCLQDFVVLKRVIFTCVLRRQKH